MLAGSEGNLGDVVVVVLLTVGLLLIGWGILMMLRVVCALAKKGRAATGPREAT
jgi:hypothetical protein